MRSLAKKDFIDKLLVFNIDLVKSKTTNDFYYDPHTKHYTGIRKILKGWCSKVRIADKVLNMDFIHNTQGYPLYFNIVDNYDDLRVRFFKEIERFRSLGKFTNDQILTFIIDRGIFSSKVFNNITNLANTHLITWEVGYKNDKWNKGKKCETGKIERNRNNLNDKKEPIQYSFQELKWVKNPLIRQIIVRCKWQK